MHIDRPGVQEGPQAWYGPELQANPSRWLIELSDADIAEIETAAGRTIDRGTPIADVTKDGFPLPTLGPRLAQVAEQLLHGIGFVVMRRIPIEGCSIRHAATMFYGLGAHLGRARMQNAKGHVLGHVCDLDLRSDDPRVRIYQTNERQTFHTDSTDVVGLLCLKTARRGGESLLVSSATIYNEMLRTRPDLVQLLFDPIATDRRGEIPEGMQPFFSIPVFSWLQGHLTVMYQRQYIDSAQRFDAAFRLTPEHVQALDLFDELANDPRLHLSMALEPGDMQFVYNHGLLRDRTAFEDWPDRPRRRHLLRLWLSVPNDRPLPPVFAERFGTVERGNRGGISVPGAEPCAPLEAG